MLTIRETGLALTGVWQLAHLDAKGMAYFDRSPEGFWRSFRVAVLIAPAYALTVALHLLETPVAAGWPRVVIVQAIAYVIVWVAFPLAVHHVSRMLDRNAEYTGYIVAYNWANILRIAVYLPALLLAVGRVLPDGLGQALLLAVTVAIIVFDWFVAKTALRIAGPPAAGIVALDLAIGLLVNAAANDMVT